MADHESGEVSRRIVASAPTLFETRWYIALRPDGDGTVVTQGFERLALPDPDERAFENDLFGGRVRRNLANIEASAERLANLVET